MTGETRDLNTYRAQNGLTTIPLALAPYESGFVVFRGNAHEANPTSANFPNYRALTTIDGPWNVAFEPKWGGPASVIFPQLEDWTQRPEAGIKKYSGHAVYTTQFALPAGKQPQSTRYRLSLGGVKNIAAVKLNGRDLGVVWCDPWSVSIPARVLKPTGNTLEVRVANLWANRLIADSGLPPSQRLTSTTYNPFNPTSPRLPSGLLGPVSVQIQAD